MPQSSSCKTTLFASSSLHYSILLTSSHLLSYDLTLGPPLVRVLAFLPQHLSYICNSEDDPTKSRRVELSALRRPSDNPICAVKCLLILALRTGATSSTTIDGILSNAAAHAQGKVVWIHRSRPVLASFPTASAGLEIDKPAGTHQAGWTINAAAILAGITQPITPHDMRRGGVRDLANLRKSNVPDSIHAGIAATLGHSRRAMHAGVTDDYAQLPTRDTWAMRAAEQDLIDPFDLTSVAPPLSFRKRNYENTRWLCTVKKGNGMRQMREPSYEPAWLQGSKTSVLGDDLVKKTRLCTSLEVSTLSNLILSSVI